MPGQYVLVDGADEVRDVRTACRISLLSLDAMEAVEPSYRRDTVQWLLTPLE